MPKSSVATLDLRDQAKNYSSRKGTKIDRIVVHHMAGKLTWQQCLAAFKSRNGSATYIIDKDGVCAYVVDEQYRPWTTSTAVIDNRAITIEVANDETGGDWHVSDRNYAILLDLLTDICKRYGLTLTYTGNKATSVLQAHRWWSSTLCPGPYLYGKFPEIATEVQRRLKEDNSKMTTLKNGFSTFTANGVTCGVYKGKYIGLIVPDKPAQLKDMDAPVYILSKAGNDLFEMTGSDANAAGTIYGPYCSIDGKAGQPADPTNYLVFLIDKDGKLTHGEWDGQYRDPASIAYMCSPQAIFSTDGIRYAHYRGSKAYTSSWYQAFIVHFTDGTYGNGVSRGAVQPKYIWQALQSMGADVVAFMDGGSGSVGSAQMLYWDGTKMTAYQSSGRAVADITVIYNKAVDSKTAEDAADSGAEDASAAEIAALKAQVEGLTAQLETATKEAETAKSDRDAAKAEASALEEKIKKIREIVA